MQTVEIHQVDVFTDRVFGGNPAAVVTNADGLSDREMASLANEMNLSETAFVLKPKRSEAALRLRFFSPQKEVDFCGHATIGALFELTRLRMMGLGRPGSKGVAIETNIGILHLTSTVMEDGGIHTSFTAPALELVPYKHQAESFFSRLGMSPELLCDNATIYRDKKLGYLYVPLKSLKELNALNFDFGLIRRNFAAEDVGVFCLYTNQTYSPKASLHARGLAPFLGIDEDPFTGSMQAGMMKAAMLNQMLPDGTKQIVTEQGHAIGRPGGATVTYDPIADGYAVSGTCVHVFSATVKL